MRITLILAVDSKGLIGDGDRLPWKLPADLQYFKRKTLGKTIIMGRKTCESLPYPLPDRRNIVLTRNKNFKMKGFETINDILECPFLGVDELMVIGGATLYDMFLPLADKVLLTLVDGDYDGDIYFDVSPLFNSANWDEISYEFHSKDDKNNVDYAFLEFKRNNE